MANLNVVGALYNSIVNSGNIQHKIWPNVIAGVKVTAGAKVFGTAAQVVAAAAIVDPSWLEGIICSANAAPTAANEWRIDIATPTNYLSTGTATPQGLVGFGLTQSTAAGIYPIPPCVLQYPIRIGGTPKVMAASDEILVGSLDIYVAIQCANGVGT